MTTEEILKLVRARSGKLIGRTLVIPGAIKNGEVVDGETLILPNRFDEIIQGLRWNERPTLRYRLIAYPRQ